MEKKFLWSLIVLVVFLSPFNYGLSLQGLTAYYSFSGNANDSGSYGYHGTVSGATLTQDRFGNANSAYQFSNAYISLPSMSQLNTNEITAGIWIYMTSSTDVQQVMEGHVSAGEFYLETAPGTSSMRYSIAGVGSLTTGTLPLNTWTHLAVVSSPTKQQIYVNGALVGENILSAASFTMTTGFTLGRDHEAAVQYWNGKLDDAIFFQRALSSNEILELYNSVTPIPEPGTFLLSLGGFLLLFLSRRKS